MPYPSLKGDVFYDREYVTKDDEPIELFVKPVFSKNNIGAERTWADTNMQGQGIFPGTVSVQIKTFRLSIEPRTPYDCYKDATVRFIVGDYPQLTLPVEEAIQGVNLHGTFGAKDYYLSHLLGPKHEFRVIAYGFKLDDNKPIAVRVLCEIVRINPDLIEKDS
jgi:hypothetical protein